MFGAIDTFGYSWSGGNVHTLHARLNVEAEGPESAGRAELKIYRQRSAARWRRSTRATG